MDKTDSLLLRVDVLEEQVIILQAQIRYLLKNNENAIKVEKLFDLLHDDLK